jgi:hypothetical protein
MDSWLFLDYLEERNVNPIRDWLMDKRQVPVKARAKIQRILTQLAGTPLWKRPLASNLEGYDGIVEIRVLYMNTQYRLLGFRGPADRQFTILFPALEQGDRFVPESAAEIAMRRMQIVISNEGRTCEHRFS